MDTRNQISRLCSRQEGQGFMEVIVAIGIMIMGIVSILILTSYNLSSAEYGENRLIASNLAREAIEVIRNIRDSNWVAGDDWDSDLPNAVADHRQIIKFTENATEGIYILESAKEGGVSVEIDTCDDCKLYVKDTIFSHDNTGTDSGFKRQVEFREICSDDLDNPKSIDNSCVGNKVGYAIKSIVQWQASNGEVRKVAIDDRIFNWR